MKICENFSSSPSTTISIILCELRARTATFIATRGKRERERETAAAAVYKISGVLLCRAFEEQTRWRENEHNYGNFHLIWDRNEILFSFVEKIAFSGLVRALGNLNLWQRQSLSCLR